MTNVSHIGHISPQNLDRGPSQVGGDGAPAQATGGFGDTLRTKMQQLNDSQVEAGNTAQDLATGQVDDIAQAMLRIEQANVTLQLATQVRNKVIEAYQEIMRMQV